MEPDWSDKKPIYLQVRDRIATLMLEGLLKEGEALPSVRNLAAQYRINPITVSKGYQQLVDEALVEKRRGVGMFVAEGALGRLRQNERKLFLEQEWPQILERLRRLGIDPRALLERLDDKQDEGA